MKLHENPFAVLGASPRDSRHALTEKADEAALIGGAQVDEALSSLLQPNKRLQAELAYFPGASDEAARAFLDYEEAVFDGKQTKMPQLSGLESPLAQANALTAFFEAWPDARMEYQIGLFRSLNRILEKVSTSETLAYINEDRKKGGWEPVADESALASPLEDRLRELCQIIGTRVSGTLTDFGAGEMVNKLLNYPDVDGQGTVARAVCDAYLLRVHDQEEKAREQVNQIVSRSGSAPTAATLDALQSALEAWCTLTNPVRKTDAKMRQAGHNLCHSARECIVTYVNAAPSQSKKISKTIPTVNGSRTITLTYQTKEAAINKAIEKTKWLIRCFPEQNDFVDKLIEDESTLNGMIRRTEENARKALLEAK